MADSVLKIGSADVQNKWDGGTPELISGVVALVNKGIKITIGDVKVTIDEDKVVWTAEKKKIIAALEALAKKGEIDKPKLAATLKAINDALNATKANSKYKLDKVIELLIKGKGLSINQITELGGETGDVLIAALLDLLTAADASLKIEDYRAEAAPAAAAESETAGAQKTAEEVNKTGVSPLETKSPTTLDAKSAVPARAAEAEKAAVETTPPWLREDPLKYLIVIVRGNEDYAQVNLEDGNISDVELKTLGIDISEAFKYLINQGSYTKGSITDINNIDIAEANRIIETVINYACDIGGYKDYDKMVNKLGEKGATDYIKSVVDIYRKSEHFAMKDREAVRGAGEKLFDNWKAIDDAASADNGKYTRGSLLGIFDKDNQAYKLADAVFTAYYKDADLANEETREQISRHIMAVLAYLSSLEDGQKKPMLSAIGLSDALALEVPSAPDNWEAEEIFDHFKSAKADETKDKKSEETPEDTFETDLQKILTDRSAESTADTKLTKLETMKTDLTTKLNAATTDADKDKYLTRIMEVNIAIAQLKGEKGDAAGEIAAIDDALAIFDKLSTFEAKKTAWGMLMTKYGIGAPKTYLRLYEKLVEYYEKTFNVKLETGPTSNNAWQLFMWTDLMTSWKTAVDLIKYGRGESKTLSEYKDTKMKSDLVTTAEGNISLWANNTEMMEGYISMLLALAEDQKDNRTEADKWLDKAKAQIDQNRGSDILRSRFRKFRRAEEAGNKVTTVKDAKKDLQAGQYRLVEKNGRKFYVYKVKSETNVDQVLAEFGYATTDNVKKQVRAEYEYNKDDKDITGIGENGVVTPGKIVVIPYIDNEENGIVRLSKKK